MAGLAEMGQGVRPALYGQNSLNLNCRYQHARGPSTALPSLRDANSAQDETGLRGENLADLSVNDSGALPAIVFISG
jgi:hypothetical protein